MSSLRNQLLIDSRAFEFRIVKFLCKIMCEIGRLDMIPQIYR